MNIQHNDDYYYDVVRKNIKKYRLEKGYTQQRLADETDLTADYICEIESLTRNKGFSLATIGRIADALNVPINEFFYDSSNNN